MTAYHSRVSQNSSNFSNYVVLFLLCRNTSEITQKKFQPKILGFGPPAATPFCQDPLILAKFKVAQIPTYCIPIDAEFHVDFKNVYLCIVVLSISLLMVILRLKRARNWNTTSNFANIRGSQHKGVAAGGTKPQYFGLKFSG